MNAPQRRYTAAALDRALHAKHSPLVTGNGGQRIDTALMLAQGSIAGPYRRTRPVTVTWRTRLIRAARALFRSINRSNP